MQYVKPLTHEGEKSNHANSLKVAKLGNPAGDRLYRLFPAGLPGLATFKLLAGLSHLKPVGWKITVKYLINTLVSSDSIKLNTNINIYHHS